MREAYDAQRPGRRLSRSREARQRPLITTAPVQPAPRKPGVTLFERIDPAAVAEIIDWTPFFVTWSLRGSLPNIFKSPKYGAEARKTFDAGRAELDDLIRGRPRPSPRRRRPLGRRRVGDDVEVFADEAQSRNSVASTSSATSVSARRSATCRSLADLVSTEKGDHLGAFAVTAGQGGRRLRGVLQADGPLPPDHDPGPRRPPRRRLRRMAAP
jgi:5-methyltetrahydrofolate--homocysteine methyltransferase